MKYYNAIPLRRGDRMILQTGKMTKVFNLPRGSGKSMRMLYASEFTLVPILCTNTSKDYLRDLAKRYEIKIPEPITVAEYVRNKAKYPKVLVDEALCVLKDFLARTEILGVTLSDEDNNNRVARWDESGVAGIEVME